MRQRIFGILVVLFALPAHAQHVEYYSDFPFWESPLQMFKGQNPITEEQAKTRQNVRAEFDALGRIVDVQMRGGEVLKAPAAFFRSLHFHVAHTRIEYTGNQATHRFYNRFGTRVTAWGEVWEKVYELDVRGRPVSMSFFGRDGAPIDNAWGSARFDWAHAHDGSVIETRHSLAGELMPHRRGFQFKRIRMTFAPDGNLALMQNINENGDLVNSDSGAAQYRYFYDAAGMFDRWEVYDAAGEPALGPTGTAGEQYKNGPNGFEEIAFFNTAGERSLHGSGAAYWRGSYDQHGNIAELAFYGVDEEPILGRQGFHKHQYRWSADGLHVMERTYLGTDDKLISTSDGIARVAYVRDARGLATEVRFFDAAGGLAFNSYEQAAILRYSFDEGGVQTDMVRLDINGAVLSD
ncbi:MAG: hypothetical protein JJ850_16240 [Kordiimonadaceae bacterium]|nr:hypothetical protein [Kordiimonadaceae bacterium]MBO6569638.1 hypothetical protein [Kordiimonadaceae bacterium]MBO6966173.1 hypothetical protein [Kordiimonadaceae bacterium]